MPAALRRAKKAKPEETAGSQHDPFIRRRLVCGALTVGVFFYAYVADMQRQS